MSLDFCFTCGEMEARRAIDTVSVEQRYRGQIEVGGYSGKFLG